MSEIILNQFESRRSIRKVEKRGDTLYVQCLGCNRMKPKSEFGKHHYMLLGVMSRCKVCAGRISRRKQIAIKRRRELARVA